jgi:type VI secretion system protein ImpJ
MGWRNKVVWSEGMLLQPQHFQQQERWTDHTLNGRFGALNACGWGFTALEFDGAALLLGKVALIKAVGVFPDGTAFDMPAIDPLPPPLDIPADLREARIWLTLPVRRPGTREANTEGDDPLVRYDVSEESVADANTTGERDALIQLGLLRCKLLPQAEVSDAMAGLPLARVVERRTDQSVLLHRGHIPTLLDTHTHEVLRGYLSELHGLLNQRSLALAPRLTQGGRGGVAEIADFLLLQTVNRYLPPLAQMLLTQPLHPLRFFETGLMLAGDLSVFNETRRPPDFPAYQHDDLEACFRPLMDDLRRSLSLVLEQNAIQIELHDRNHGVRVAILHDAQLRREAAFVLAVNARMPDDALRARFPSQVKIGPVERIRDLVNLQLPGVTLRPLPVAPRQIPYHAGFNYFELDTRNNDLWRQLDQSGGLAMHIAGEFPGLELAFWAIRS